VRPVLRERLSERPAVPTQLRVRHDIERRAEPLGQRNGIALFDPQVAVDDSEMTAELMAPASPLTRTSGERHPARTAAPAAAMRTCRRLRRKRSSPSGRRERTHRRYRSGGYLPTLRPRRRSRPAPCSASAQTPHSGQCTSAGESARAGRDAQDLLVQICTPPNASNPPRIGPSIIVLALACLLILRSLLVAGRFPSSCVGSEIRGSWLIGPALGG
jgi:hypothetical protein